MSVKERGFLQNFTQMQMSLVSFHAVLLRYHSDAAAVKEVSTLETLETLHSSPS